jgi:putative membrane protein
MNQQTIEAVNSNSRTVVMAIVAISAGAIAFLLWLIYLHHAPEQFATRWNFLPTLNAVLNGLAAVALVVGYLFIRQRKVRQHRASMLTAFVFSSLFLVSYIVNHALHGDMIFPGHGAVRTIYLGILISHIVLSVVALPMVLTTFFFSLSGRIPQHRKIARFTFPIWLYVSVTGVVVRVMLGIYS